MFSHHFTNMIDKLSSPLNDIFLLSEFDEYNNLENGSSIFNNSSTIKELSLLSLSEEINDAFLKIFSSPGFIQNPSDIFSDENKNEKNFNDMFIESKESEKNIVNKNNLINNNLETVKKFEKKNYFKVIYPSNKQSNAYEIDEKDILLAGKRKKFPFKRNRMDNRDNIRKKIKRGFFNVGLRNKLNQYLKRIGSNKYFEKFPQRFVSDIDQKRGKEVFSMTLREILNKKELYKREDKSGMENFLHNLKVVQSEDIKANKDFEIILDKKIRELYEEYINSNEFKVNEINRLKKKNLKDDYINSYIYFSNHLIKFFS